MGNNPDLPEGWAMPDDLAKQVNQVLNRKSITPEQELQDALDEMARDIAIIEPNPVDWGWWVKYFLDQLEGEAAKRFKIGNFKAMLKNLSKDILSLINLHLNWREYWCNVYRVNHFSLQDS